MNFYLDGKYSAFEELMHYYHINFYVYYILLVIVLINSGKTVVNYYYFKKQKPIRFASGNIDLFLSMLAGMGLGCGLLFNGIFADMSSKYFKIWGYKIIILCICAFILFVIQIIFMDKIKKLEKQP